MHSRPLTRGHAHPHARAVRAQAPARPLSILFLCLALGPAAGCGSDDPEPAGPVVRFVRPDGQGDFSRIQPCIEASRNGDTCFVYPGTYRENLRFNGKRIVVLSKDGPHSTTVDGGGTGPVVQFVDYETRNTVLSGFTLLNGLASMPESGMAAAPDAWAAMAQAGSEHGGGVRILAASPVIRDSVIRGNAADGNGGGVFCAFTGSRPRFENVVIHDNQAAGRGGGLYVFSGSVELANCLVVLNTAADGGGIAAEFGARATLSNTTLGDNAAATDAGAAAFRLFNSSATWTDSIAGDRLWDPAPAFPLVVLELDRTQPSPGAEPALSLSVDHVSLQGGLAAVRYEGDCLSEPNPCAPEDPVEIPGDPLFVELAAGTGEDPTRSYFLSQTGAGQAQDSPCVDAGSITAAQAGLDTRTTQNGQNGRQRPDSGTVDLGYHYAIVLP